MNGEEFFQIGQRPLTPAEMTCRAVFLDFDNSTRRRVPVIPMPTEAELTEEAIERILATLNDTFANRYIEFFSDPPDDRSYHTIYVNDPVVEPTPNPEDVIDIEAEMVTPNDESSIVEKVMAKAEEIFSENK